MDGQSVCKPISLKSEVRISEKSAYGCQGFRFSVSRFRVTTARRSRAVVMTLAEALSVSGRPTCNSRQARNRRVSPARNRHVPENLKEISRRTGSVMP